MGCVVPTLKGRNEAFHLFERRTKQSISRLFEYELVR